MNSLKSHKPNLNHFFFLAFIIIGVNICCTISASIVGERFPIPKSRRKTLLTLKCHCVLACLFSMWVSGILSRPEGILQKKGKKMPINIFWSCVKKPIQAILSHLGKRMLGEKREDGRGRCLKASLIDHHSLDYYIVYVQLFISFWRLLIMDQVMNIFLEMYYDQLGILDCSEIVFLIKSIFRCSECFQDLVYLSIVCSFQCSCCFQCLYILWHKKE